MTARRILHVINLGTTCGGAERLASALVAAQRRQGHQVRVLSSDRDADGVRFSDVTWPQRTGGPWWRRLAGLFRNPAASAALTAQLREFRPDVVHLHTVGLLSPSALRALADVPTVHTLHGPEPFLRTAARYCMPASYHRAGAPDRPSWRGWLWLLLTAVLLGPLWRRALGVVDLRIAPSRYIAGLAGGATLVVPNGLTSAPPAPAATGPGPRVVFAGRLVPAKGPHVLVDAVPRLLEAVPDARVTICGDGPLLTRLRRRVDELGIGYAVELTGWLDPPQVAARIAGADVVVVPSVWPEGFGLTCLEALAAGRAVVASDVGALSELVTPGRTGLLVPPAEPDALAGAVALLLGNPPLRDRLGAAGRELSRGYGMDAHHEAVSAAYTEAIAQPRRPSPLARLRDDSLLRNSAMLLLATLTLAGGGFIFWQFVARLFTPAEVGEASALISVSTLLANIALLGMNNSLIRYLDRWPDPARTVNTGVLVVAAAALAGATVFVLAAPLLLPIVAGGLTPARAAAFVALTVIAALGMLYDNVFIAWRRSGHILSRNVLVVAMRLVLPGVLAGLGAFGVFGAYWLAFAVALLPNLVVLGRRYRLRAAGSARRLGDMWRYSIGTYVSSIILMLPTLLMPALVTQRTGAEPAAQFYIASLVAGVLLFVPQAAGRGLFAEAQHDGGRVGAHLPRVLRLTAVVQVPLLALLVAAGWPVLLIFGPVYADAYPLMILLAVANALNSIGYVGSTLLLVSGRTRLLCLLSGAAYGIAVVGGWFVAPYGLMWIGGALLAGELVLAGGYLWVIMAALREPPPSPPATPAVPRQRSSVAVPEPGAAP
ncbi:glycosyltransferase [Catenuloplanes atrovinosus]|uniref:Glycosyltransferase involved in cell wall biosynthesis/O-antigen/teichoic acid export membrane protein n=1 Tax=Catenuloplanes atrovinosus TaxID=137266 RepID=A0AAE4CA96_9ACTN|nr:glycosyltransferase [Catenuloplanes atrovinosus]MDR7275609.1 glycosyltransferase involved in cell wall biosynthesis/O-antigen/teichoic acid export membrane protein [Catenuloplanes atrovinosus]